MNRTIILILITALMACGPTRHDLKHVALTEGRASVEGSRILMDGKPVAELKFLNRKSPIESLRLSLPSSVLGISITYLQTGEERWVFPKGGWIFQNDSISLSKRPVQTLTEIANSWNGISICGGKSTIIFTNAFDIQISNHGKYIHYTVPGLTSDTTYAFSVEDGSTKRIKKRWKNRIF